MQKRSMLDWALPLMFMVWIAWGAIPAIVFYITYIVVNSFLEWLLD